MQWLAWAQTRQHLRPNFLLNYSFSSRIFDFVFNILDVGLEAFGCGALNRGAASCRFRFCRKEAEVVLVSAQVVAAVFECAYQAFAFVVQLVVVALERVDVGNEALAVCAFFGHIELVAHSINSRAVGLI